MCSYKPISHRLFAAEYLQSKHKDLCRSVAFDVSKPNYGVAYVVNQLNHADPRIPSLSMYIHTYPYSPLYTKHSRERDKTERENRRGRERNKAKKKEKERKEKKIMRFFLTGLISSMTITTTALSIPLYYHNRNRQSQALILRQQTQLLTSLVNDPTITQRLRSDAKQQQAQLKSGWTERGKDWWNEEVIRRAVDLLFAGPARGGSFFSSAPRRVD